MEAFLVAAHTGHVSTAASHAGQKHRCRHGSSSTHDSPSPHALHAALDLLDASAPSSPALSPPTGVSKQQDSASSASASSPAAPCAAADRSSWSRVARRPATTASWLLATPIHACPSALIWHNLSHDLHVYNNFRGLPLMDEMPGGSLYLDGQLGRAPAVAGTGNSVFGDVDLAWNDNHGFVQRKRACMVAEGPVPVTDVLTRAAGSGPESTSGRMANAAGLQQDLLSQLCRQGMEIDALVRVETERMRAGLEEARRRHVWALLLASERAAAGHLRAAEAALELARSRNANLSERLCQISAEGQAWIGVAKSHEAAVAGLRATLDQLLQSPSAAEGAAGEGADAEDARSCCFETPAGGDDAADDGEAASNKSRAACKACGEGESCVLVLPCRHLCLCPACDAAVDMCPVCAATKNASLHVLLS